MKSIQRKTLVLLELSKYTNNFKNNLKYLFIIYFQLLFIFRSAYLFYTKDQTSKVREELLKDGKDASMGATVTIISKRVSDLNITIITMSNILFTQAFMFSTI